MMITVSKMLQDRYGARQNGNTGVRSDGQPAADRQSENRETEADEMSEADYFTLTSWR